MDQFRVKSFDRHNYETRKRVGPMGKFGKRAPYPGISTIAAVYNMSFNGELGGYGAMAPLDILFGLFRMVFERLI